MSTNHPTHTQVSARLSRLLIESQGLADRLAAEPFDGDEAELELSGPMLLLAEIMDTLESALWSAQNYVGSRRAQDLACARVLAGV